LPGYVPPAPKVVLEGNYSTWTIYDSFDDAGAADTTYGQEAVVNREETVIVIIDCLSAEVVKSYTISTKTLSGALISALKWAYNYYTEQISCKSAYGTYFVAHNTENLYVLKNGSIVKTLSATALGFNAGTIRSVSISLKGKYTIASGQRTVTGNPGWVVLVGS